VAQHHGLSIKPSEIAAMLGLASVSTLGELVVASRLLGFESVPLEGEYDDLVELVLPGIVVLGEGSEKEPQFAVLVAFESAFVLLADPAAGGSRRVLREEFCAQWHGGLLQLVPDESGLALARERLALHRSPMKRILQALRFAPPRGPKLVFTAALVGLPALVGALARGPIAPTIAGFALTLASVSSLWLALFGSSCSRCGAAHHLTGALPLERVGVVLYSVLLGLTLALPWSTVPAYGLLAASGGHVWLLILLARARTVCWACLLTAFGAFTATALLVLHTDPSAVVGAGLFAIGLGGMALATRFFQRAAQHAGLWESRRLALSMLQKDHGDVVRVVVWKRAGCASCLIWEAALKPGLLQELGDAIAIEEHDAGARPIPTPLILIDAPMPVLFVGLPGTDDDGAVLLTAIEAARKPDLAMLAPLGGIYIVDGYARA
jgi:hypothetical protein